MGQNVLVAVGYGVEGEALIKRASEMVGPDDNFHILVLDYQNQEHHYNKVVDLEQLEFYAEKYDAVYEVREISNRKALDHVIDYSKKNDIRHLIIGETKSQVVSLVVQISPVQYLLRNLPMTVLTIIPYDMAVDKDYFDYAPGEKVFVVKEGDKYVINRDVNDPRGHYGIFYKSHTTDFDTGLIYVFFNNDLKQVKVTNGELVDPNF